MSFIEAIIELPYSRPGDDLNNCINQNKIGIVNVKKTLRNMIDFLKISIKNLEDIDEIIPENNALDIYGSGQNIGICGDDEIILKLIEKGLIIEEDFKEDFETLSDDSFNSIESSESEDLSIDGK